MTRICHLIASPTRGAPREMIRQIVSAERFAGYDHAVAFLNDGAHEQAALDLESMWDDFVALDIPLFLGNMVEPYQYPAGLRDFSRFLRSAGVGVLVSHLPRADLVSASVGTVEKLRRVRVLHHLDHLWLNKPRPVTELSAWMSRSADVVVTVSTELADLVESRQHVPAERVRPIPGGIDLTRYSVPALPFTTDRPPTVGVCSRLDADHKGLFEFVEAIAQVAGKVPELAVTVAGSGPDREVLEADAARRGVAITFLGHVDDVPGFLATVDVFVQPSRREGMPYSLLEAGAACRTLVVTRVGGMPELVRTGETGYCVTPQQPSELADAILDAVTHPEQSRELGAAAGEAMKGFSVETMLGRWADVYASVAGPPATA